MARVAANDGRTDAGRAALQSFSTLHPLVREDARLGDRFELFFKGRSSPFTRTREAVIGIELFDAARRAGLGRKALSKKARLDFERFGDIVGGMFRMEDDGEDARRLGRITGVSIDRISPDRQIAILDSNFGMFGRDFGFRRLTRKIWDDRRARPGLYVGSLAVGLAFRTVNELQERPWRLSQLARTSQVSAYYLKLLADGNVPPGQLDYRAEYVAVAFGKRLETLRELGMWILEKTSATANEEAGHIVSRFKRLSRQGLQSAAV